MTRAHSLRLRQLALAVFTISVALLISFAAFSYLFERHVERRFESELQLHLSNIADDLVVGQDQRVHLARELSAPQFNTPLSGFYWRIQDLQNGEVLRSRSLWDIDLPASQQTNNEMFVVSRHLTLSEKDARRPLLIEVALDRKIIDKTRNEFSNDLVFYLVILGLVLLLITALQIELGLWPLKGLRRDVEKITTAPKAHMGKHYPSEVLPLTDTINRLLDARAKSIEEAERRAADLAHSLKSPLAALRNQATRLEMAGEADYARTLRDLSLDLERQINRELTRTRAEIAAQKGHVSCNIHALIEQLLRVLKNTAQGEQIVWKNLVAENSFVPLDNADMAEALGPLLENAARHARERVTICYENHRILIDDDGKGMSHEQREKAIQRGVRYDERGDSTGLGLAIAHEVLAPYGWGFSLHDSPLGGLRVCISAQNTQKTTKTT